MATKNIPVSYEFFKKYTYHEEWISVMLKLKTKGDQQMYDRLINNKEVQERALKAYYEAFYLRPIIREKYHIRLKSAPKRFKAKLLSIPVQHTNTINEAEREQTECVAVTDIYMKDIIKDLDLNRNTDVVCANKNAFKKRILLSTQNLFDEECTVIDDNEPALSPNPALSSHELQDKTNSSSEKQNSKITKMAPASKCPEEIKDKAIKPSSMISGKDHNQGIIGEKSMPTNKRLQHQNSEANTTSADEKSDRKKTAKASKQSGVEKQINNEKQKKVSIAVNTDSKMENQLVESVTYAQNRENAAAKTVTCSMSKVSENVIQIPATTACVRENNKNVQTKEPLAPSMQQQKNSKTGNLIEINSNKSKEAQPHAAHVAQQNITTAKAIMLDGRDKNNAPTPQQHQAPTGEANRLQLQSSTGHPPINITTPLSAHTNNNHMEKQETCTPSSSEASAGVISFPVSLIEFKKRTHYEETVQNLFKLKAENDESLYLKYCSNKKAFDDTITNYYRAFYLLPIIREICPIRLKSMPKCFRNLLLQIPEGVFLVPLDMSTIKQHIVPDINAIDVNQNESPAAIEAETAAESIEPMVTETVVALKTDNVPSPLSAVETSVSNRCLKRTSNDDIAAAESSSPKQRKISVQRPNYALAPSKDLLRYERCCPVSYVDFAKYTNLAGLFTRFCQKTYNSLKKLPLMLKRAHILFYLEPRQRSLQPFTRLIVLDECPLSIKEKLFEIPTDLEIEKITREIQKDHQEAEMAKVSEANLPQNRAQQQQNNSPRKTIVEILENRLLTPTVQQSLATAVHDSSPTNRTINTTNNVETNLEATTAAKICVNISKDSSSETQTKHIINNVPPKQVATATKTVDIPKEKNSSSTQTEHVTNNVPTKQVATATKTVDIPKENFTSAQTEHVRKQKPATKLVDVWKNERLFSGFCQKLLAKVQQSLDRGTVDFSSECYKIFLKCNYIPLKEMLKGVCENNDKFVQSVLNKTELYEALRRYYYLKYMTNKEFALKYPVKMLTNELQQEKTKAGVVDKTQSRLNSSSGSEKTVATQSKRSSVQPEKSASINKALEKAKRIFFRNVDKAHTLVYVLRTTFDYKQAILRTVLDLTFDEFIELTTVYEGKELYADRHVAECMYRYVCCKPLVWPTNLFMTLENLCNFLRKKDIYFDNWSTMLFHISPKILHWSNLLECTNFLECVKCDYEKRTGKLLDTDNALNLEQECINYYNRCWKYEKWLADTPLLDEEFCKKISYHNTDEVVMEDEHSNTLCCNDADAEVAGNYAEAAKFPAPDSDADIIVLSPSEMNRTADDEEESNESNYIGMPNTQQQIEMLPDEQSPPHDPLGNSVSSLLSLNVSPMSLSDHEVETVDEVIQEPIKIEPVEAKLLSNLIFYEDDNDVMQCASCEEEIIELDVTLKQSQKTKEELLPVSQIGFDVLRNSEDFQSLMVQHTPNVADSNDTNTQQPSSQANQMVKLNNSNLLCSENLPTMLVQHIPGALDSKQSSFQAGEMTQLHDVNFLRSWDKTHQPEDATAKTVEVLGPELNEMLSGILANNCTRLQEAQRFPSSFEETQNSNENSGGQKISKTVEDIIDSSLAQKGKQQATDKPSDEPSTSKTSCRSSYQANTHTAALRICAGTTNTKAAAKTKRNVAAVKLLSHASVVPQIQHNTRPLQTVPAFTATATATTSNSNPAPQTTELQIVTPGSLMFNLTPTSGSSNSSGPSSQNSSVQLQLPPVGSRTFISQELNKNCSVFDNSSVLRIVDRNYAIETTTTNLGHAATEQSLLAEETQHQPDATSYSNNSTCPDSNNVVIECLNNEQHQQQPVDKINVLPPRRVTRSNSKSLNNCSSQPNTGSNLFKACTAGNNQEEEDQQQQQHQACRRIVISSLCQVTNDKVNNLTPANTNNVITSRTITNINPQQQQQPLQQATQMAHKVFLYRGIYKFHYFKELTSQHMSTYLLPSLQVGKSYSEALVVCENFKTRVSNRSISALCPFWPPALQRDFLLVLDDLREFHYNVFERKSMQKQEDLRARVLYWLLDTAPAFSLCQFVYEKNNSEFSHCEAIKSHNNTSYKRKPFKSLTNALNARLLKKLETMKKDRHFSIL